MARNALSAFKKNGQNCLCKLYEHMNIILDKNCPYFLIGHVLSAFKKMDKIVCIS